MSVYPQIPPLSMASVNAGDGLSKANILKSHASLASPSSASSGGVASDSNGDQVYNGIQAADGPNQNSFQYQHKQHPFGSLTSLDRVIKNGLDLLASPSSAEVENQQQNATGQRPRERASYAGSTSSIQPLNHQQQMMRDRSPYRSQAQYGIPVSHSNGLHHQYGGGFPPVLPYSSSNNMPFHPQDSGSLWSPAPQYRSAFPYQHQYQPQQYRANGGFTNNVSHPLGVPASNSGIRPASPGGGGFSGNLQQVPNSTGFSDENGSSSSSGIGGGGFPSAFRAQSQTHDRRESMMIDKFQLLKMIQTQINSTCTEAEDYFRMIYERSGAKVVSWPSTVEQVAAQTKMRPEVSIELRGTQQNIELAKTIISQLLDAKMHRVTLHMYVTFAEHSHIIGKGGNNVRTISEDTKCHIHFPDCNRNAKPQDKSNLVTITGGLPGVEVARQRVRSLLPLNFMFDVPLQNLPLPGINEIKAHLESAQKQFRITANLQINERTRGHFILVRGPQDDRTLKGVLKVLNYFAGPLDARHIEVRTSLEVLPQHQYHMRDPHTLGKYIDEACHNFNTRVKFPIDESSSHNNMLTMGGDSSQPSYMTPSTVLIYGLPESCYGTWAAIQALLPIKVAFDVKTTQEFPEGLVNYIRDNLQVDIQFRTKYHNKCKTVSLPQTVSMATIERNINNIFEARRQMLRFDVPEVPPESAAQVPMVLDFNYALLRDDMTANSTLQSVPLSNGDYMSVEKLPDNQVMISTNFNPLYNDKLAEPYQMVINSHVTALDGTDSGSGPYENTFGYGVPQQHRQIPFKNNNNKFGGDMNEAFQNMRVGSEMPLGRPMPPTSSSDGFPLFYSNSMPMQKQQKSNGAEMFMYQKLPNYAGAVNNNQMPRPDAASDAGTPTLDAVNKHLAMVNNASYIGSSGGGSDDSSATYVPSKNQQQSPLLTAQNFAKRSSVCGQPTQDFQPQLNNYRNGIAMQQQQQLQNTINSSANNSFYTNSSGVSSSSAGGNLNLNGMGDNGNNNGYGGNGNGEGFSESSASDVSRLISDSENNTSGPYDLSFVANNNNLASYDGANIEQCPASPEILSPATAAAAAYLNHQRTKQQQHQRLQLQERAATAEFIAGERRPASSNAGAMQWNSNNGQHNGRSHTLSGANNMQKQQVFNDFNSHRYPSASVWSDSSGSFFGGCDLPGSSDQSSSSELYVNAPPFEPSSRSSRMSLAVPQNVGEVGSGVPKRRSVASLSPLVLSPGAAASAGAIDQKTPTTDVVGAYAVVSPSNQRAHLQRQVSAGSQQTDMAAENNAAVANMPVITSDSKDADFIRAALAQVGMNHYAQLFIDQEFSLETLLSVSDGDLKELGISNFGARRRILALPKDARQRLLRGQGFGATIAHSTGSSPLTSPTGAVPFVYQGGDASRPPSSMSNTSSSSGGSGNVNELMPGAHQARRADSMTLTRHQSFQQQYSMPSLNRPNNNNAMLNSPPAAGSGGNRTAALGDPTAARLAIQARVNRLGVVFDPTGKSCSEIAVGGDTAHSGPGEIFRNDMSAVSNNSQRLAMLAAAKRRVSEGTCVGATNVVAGRVIGSGGSGGNINMLSSNRVCYPPPHHNNSLNRPNNNNYNNVAASGAAYSPNQWVEPQQQQQYRQFHYGNDAGSNKQVLTSPPYFAAMQQQHQSPQELEADARNDAAIVESVVGTPTSRKLIYPGYADDNADADDERSSSGGRASGGTTSSTAHAVGANNNGRHGDDAAFELVGENNDAENAADKKSQEFGPV